MSWTISKKPDEDVDEEKKKSDEHEVNMIVSSHLVLKGDHSAGTLDKDVVLRRIRQRKRVNKLRSLFASFFPPPKIGTNSTAANAATPQQDHSDDSNANSTNIPVQLLINQDTAKWTDNPFTAP